MHMDIGSYICAYANKIDAIRGFPHGTYAHTSDLRSPERDPAWRTFQTCVLPSMCIKGCFELYIGSDLTPVIGIEHGCNAAWLRQQQKALRWHNSVLYHSIDTSPPISKPWDVGSGLTAMDVQTCTTCSLSSKLKPYKCSNGFVSKEPLHVAVHVSKPFLDMFENGWAARMQADAIASISTFCFIRHALHEQVQINGGSRFQFSHIHCFARVLAWVAGKPVTLLK